MAESVGRSQQDECTLRVNAATLSKFLSAAKKLHRLGNLCPYVQLYVGGYEDVFAATPYVDGAQAVVKLGADPDADTSESLYVPITYTLPKVAKDAIVTLHQVGDTLTVSVDGIESKMALDGWLQDAVDKYFSSRVGAFHSTQEVPASFIRDFFSLAKEVAVCAPAKSDYGRPLLNGINIRGGRLWTTDGFWVGEALGPKELECRMLEDQTLPVRSLLALQAFVPLVGESMCVGSSSWQGTKLIQFDCSNGSLEITATEGRYPELQKIIPMDKYKTPNTSSCWALSPDPIRGVLSNLPSSSSGSDGWGLYLRDVGDGVVAVTLTDHGNVERAAATTAAAITGSGVPHVWLPPHKIKYILDHYDGDLIMVMLPNRENPNKVEDIVEIVTKSPMDFWVMPLDMEAGR